MLFLIKWWLHGFHSYTITLNSFTYMNILVQYIKNFEHRHHYLHNISLSTLCARVYVSLLLVIVIC